MAAQKKEFLPIDFGWFMGYILDNGSGDFNLKIFTIPIIKEYLVKQPASSFLPQKKGDFFIICEKNKFGTQGRNCEGN